MTVTLTLVIGLTACGGGGDSIAGTYVRNVHGAHGQSQSIRFNDDGTFVLNVFGQYAGGGKYEVHGHSVVLEYDVGKTKRGRIDGDTFIDAKGFKWTK